MAEGKARCRECYRNDVPLGEMAVYSFKAWCQIHTGICKKCMDRMIKAEEQFEAAINAELADAHH